MIFSEPKNLQNFLVRQLENCRAWQNELKKNRGFLITSLLVVVLIFIFFCFYYPTVEHYDALIEDISCTECGTRCTNATNCHAFAYKPTDRKCYLSKTAILGEPLYSLYADEYSHLDRRCSKLDYLTIDNNRYINEETLTSNSLYTCSDGENNFSDKYQYANHGASSLSGPGETELEPHPVTYDVVDLSYPKTKDEQLKQTVIYNKDGSLPEMTAAKTPSNSSKRRSPNVFVEYDNEVLGQYMQHHQCATNVSLLSCLKFCDKYKNCTGVEWNSDIYDETAQKSINQVCCPKTKLSKIIPRREKFANGHFYLKHPDANILSDEIRIASENIDNKFVDRSLEPIKET